MNNSFTIVTNSGNSFSDNANQILFGAFNELKIDVNNVIFISAYSLKDLSNKVIVAMGKEAVTTLLPDVKLPMSDLIGSIHSINDKIIIPCFHPEYILNNLNEYENFEDILFQAKGLANGTIPLPEKLPYDKVHYYKETQEIYDQIFWIKENAPKTLAIDTETVSVRDENYNLLLLQLSDGKDAWVFEVPKMNVQTRFLINKLFDDPDRTFIFHNSAFDLKVLYHNFLVWVCNSVDTMALALCLSEKLNRCGLKRLVNKYLSVPHYEEEVHKYLKSSKNTFNDIPRNVLVPYSGFDAIYTYRLFPVLKELVIKEGNYHLYEMLNKSQMTFAQMSYDGITVDLDYVDELRKEYYPKRDELSKSMQNYAFNKGFNSRDVVKSSKDGLLLVTSPVQIKYFVNNYLHIPTDTTNIDFLEKYKDYEFIKQLMKHRKISKLLDTYVDGISEDIWSDGKVHPDFIHAVETGRIVIKHPPLQTQPREGTLEASGLKSIRKLFTADKNDIFISSDYSQLEIRIACNITGDREMEKSISTLDFHRATASSVFHKRLEDVTTEERNMAKIVSFGIMYGKQAYSLSLELGCSVNEAQEYINQFFRKYHVYKDWMEETKRKALTDGVLTTEFGRKRRWKIITDELETGREAINFPIQSTASDCCLLSSINIDKILRDKQFGRVLFTVHDSVSCTVKTYYIDESCKLIKSIMENILTLSYSTLEVKIEVGSSFGAMSKWVLSI